MNLGNKFENGTVWISLRADVDSKDRTAFFYVTMETKYKQMEDHFQTEVEGKKINCKHHAMWTLWRE